MNYKELLAPVRQFLHCPTPPAWIEEARKPQHLPLLLTDHLVCELKAAQTAVWLLRKYVVADKQSGDLLLQWLAPFEGFLYGGGNDVSFLTEQKSMSKRLIRRVDLPWADAFADKMLLLIKEELHHFQQVYRIMQGRGIVWQKITASRYARGLIREVSTWEPAALVDRLICGAYIEARSCERFSCLAPFLEDDLGAFYLSLLCSEARHYQDYLTLAASILPQEMDVRVRKIGEAEARLIQQPDTVMRFHSGVPASPA